MRRNLFSEVISGILIIALFVILFICLYAFCQFLAWAIMQSNVDDENTFIVAPPPFAQSVGLVLGVGG